MVNVIGNTSQEGGESLLKRLSKAFINPITALFLALGALLAFMGEADRYTIVFISMIVLVYGILRLDIRGEES